MQRLGRFLGPVLVDEAEPDGQAHDHADDDRVTALTGEIGRNGGAQQQYQQRGPQLMPQHRQQPGPVRGHRIRTPPRQPPRSLRAGQAGISCHAELLQQARAGLLGCRHDPCRGSGRMLSGDCHCRYPAITRPATVSRLHRNGRPTWPSRTRPAGVRPPPGDAGAEADRELAIITPTHHSSQELTAHRLQASAACRIEGPLHHRCADAADTEILIARLRPSAQVLAARPLPQFRMCLRLDAPPGPKVPLAAPS